MHNTCLCLILPKQRHVYGTKYLQLVRVLSYSLKNIDLCVSPPALVHGMAVPVKHVRKTLIVLKDFSNTIVEFTAICNPACLNGGNCTGPNTCICEL